MNKNFRFWGKIHMKKAQIDIKNRLLDIKNPKVRLLTNSEYNKRNLMKIFEKDCKVVYPPVKLDEFDNNTSNRNGIMTVTTYRKWKNLEKIIDLIGSFDCSKRIFGNVLEIDKPYMNKIIEKGKEHKIKFYINQPRERMIELLQKSKIFISAGRETFGIAVVEAIASGCIPIVPNNSAHPETVPFPELRFENKSDAVEKLKKALDGEYDYLRPELKKHVVQFSEKKFQEQMIREIERKI